MSSGSKLQALGGTKLEGGGGTQKLIVMQNHVVVEEIIIRPKKMTLHHEKCINFRAWGRGGTFGRFEIFSFYFDNVYNQPS